MESRLLPDKRFRGRNVGELLRDQRRCVAICHVLPGDLNESAEIILSNRRDQSSISVCNEVYAALWPTHDRKNQHFAGDIGIQGRLAQLKA